MCGIICYVGTKAAKPILMEGLKRLEYRGYDSAGLAVQNGNEISCYREVGKIVSLEQLINGKSLEGYSGIAPYPMGDSRGTIRHQRSPAAGPER